MRFEPLTQPHAEVLVHILYRLPACGKGRIPLPLDHLLGETNPGTPGFGQRLPGRTVCRG